MHVGLEKAAKDQGMGQHHSKYVTMFHLSVEQAQSSVAAKLREFCPLAFNNYLKWFLESTRVEICKAAYHDDILEDPAAFDELSKNEYNKLVREGHRVPNAPVINYLVSLPLCAFPLALSHIFDCLTCLCRSHPQRKQIKEAADESQTILETTPIGKGKEEGALRAFIKVHISIGCPCYICC